MAQSIERFFENTQRFWQRSRYFCNMMIGVPDYQAYLTHMQTKHSGVEVMTHAQFLNSRMEARLGAKTLGKCPC